MRRILIPVAAMLLALTACGSSDASADGAASEDAASEDGAMTETTVAAPSTTAPSTTAPSTTAPSTTAPSTTPLDLADSQYCVIARAGDQLDAEFEDFGDPVALEAYLVGQIDLIEQAIAVAPPEIAADLAVIAAQFNEVGATVAAGDYALSVMMEAILEAESLEVDAASDATELYGATVCGISSDDSQDNSADNEEDSANNGSAALELTVESFELARASESTRGQMVQGAMSNSGITQEQAGCFIDEVSPELFVTLNSDAEPDDEQVVELLELLESCGIPLDALF